MRCDLGKEMNAVMKDKLPQMHKEGYAPDEAWVQAQTEAAIQRVEDEQAGWAD